MHTCVVEFLIEHRFVYSMPHTHIVDDIAVVVVVVVVIVVVVDIVVLVFVQQQSTFKICMFMYLTLSFSKTGNVLFKKENNNNI